MKRCIVLLFILLFGATVTRAQYNIKQNNVWVFGYHAGLDFNSGVPVPISTNINQFEGVSSVSDSDGNLLFYSSGDSVMDKNGNVMSNGRNLMLDYTAMSSTQASLAVPVLNSVTQYYLFSLEQDDEGNSCRLYYSIIDMSLNNNLGDVITNKKSIIIDSFLSEKMVAIQGDQCNIWLLIHERGNHIFKAYEINDNGISHNPIVSDCGNLGGYDSYTYGVIKPSNDRRKIIVASSDSYVSSTDFTINTSGIGAELYDFNPLTGEVSNPILFDSNMTYGACFSPDDSKLYLVNHGHSTLTAGEVLQYDISVMNSSSIAESKKQIYEVNNSGNDIYSDIQLGPDGKLYLNHTHDSVDYIEFPNNSYPACNFVAGGIALLTGTEAFAGLPNTYVTSLCPEVVNTVKAEPDIKVYPNPSQGEVTIETSSGFFKGEVNVFNAIGQRVYNSKLSSSKQMITLDVPNGIYVIELTGNKGAKMKQQLVIAKW